MPSIVAFPTIVTEALNEFGHLFANEPERKHFAEYLTGLYVASRKNVSAINREFVNTTDQSCLNRWLTQVDWDVQKLNDLRLEWLQKDPSTRYSEHGVIPIDNTLIDHEGKLIEDAGYFWDHADQRYKIAMDYLIVNYVCASGKHYPLEFRRFIKREDCQARQIEFHDHNEQFRELVRWVVDRKIPGDFAFDCYFTHAANLNEIHRHNRGYVGDLKFNRKIIVSGQTIKAEELAARIGPEIRKSVEIQTSDGKVKTQWYFTKTIRVPDVNHPVRIVILWDRRNATSACKIMLTNRTWWEVSRILRVYRRRWRGTECFHRDGKQHLGMGDCQLRDGLGQTRHLYMVFLAHSVLMVQLRQSRVRDWALERLTTIGQACRSVLRETFCQTLDWAIDKIQNDDWSRDYVKQYLRLM